MSKISKTLYNCALNFPEKVAVIISGEKLSYRQLYNSASQLSGLLRQLGIKRGDHVLVAIPNNFLFIKMIYAAADIGIVLVPINDTLPGSSLKVILEESEVKHIFAKASLLNLIKETGYASEGCWVSLDHPELEYINLDKALYDNSTVNDLCYAGTAEDNLFLITTSGSTGTPKPIILNQKTKFIRASSAIKSYDVTEHDICLISTPLYHSLAQRILFVSLFSGSTCVVMARYSVSEWIRAVEKFKVSFTIAVSSQLDQIIKNIDETNTLSSLRSIVSSSALLLPEIKEKLIQKLNCDFHECYGTSEIAIATSLDGRLPEKMKSVGKSIDEVEVKILKGDNRFAEFGEAGEIVCKTPLLFSGYYNNIDETKNTMFNGYFRTGDLGRLDEDGYLYFLGRIKDIIITGAINVYPSDIDDVLVKHEFIKEAAAFGIEDELLGECVAVAVVPYCSKMINSKLIWHFCANQLADFQIPRKVFIVDELPRNALGKIMRHKLVEKFGAK